MKIAIMLVVAVASWFVRLSAACDIDSISNQAAGRGGNWTQVPLNDSTVTRLQQLAFCQVSRVISKAVAIVQAYRHQNLAHNVTYYCIRFSASGSQTAIGYSASMECVAEGYKELGHQLRVPHGTVSCQNIIPACNLEELRENAKLGLAGGWRSMSDELQTYRFLASAAGIADLDESRSTVTAAFGQLVAGMNYCIGFRSVLLQCDANICPTLSCVARGFESLLYNGFSYLEPIRKVGVSCQLSSTGPIGVVELPEECSGPLVTGPCQAWIEKWRYNSTSQQCELFIYGGCDGNANSYWTEQNCQERCFGLAAGSCSDEAETGRCRMSIERWFHNTTSGRCETFTYGGCHGNANNYVTKEACEHVCVQIA